MRRENRYQVLALGLALLAILSVVVCFAGQSPNYRSYPEVVDCAGGESSSKLYRSTASVGQPIMGVAQSASYMSKSGYIRTATAPWAPMTNKRIAVAELAALREQVPPWAGEEIDDAIGFVLTSLDPILWVGPWHLNTDFIPDGGDGAESGEEPGEMSAPPGVNLKSPGVLSEHPPDGKDVGVLRGKAVEPVLAFEAAVPGMELHGTHGDDGEDCWETVLERQNEASKGPVAVSDEGENQRYGERVFKWEEKAVKKLMVLTPLLPEFAEDLDEVIADLVTADSTLAQVTLDEAIAGGGSPEEIKKAQDQMEKAERAKARGDFEVAIDHYCQAWRHAVDALLGIGGGGGLSGAQAGGTSDPPVRFSLFQNYPNPFTRATTITHALPPGGGDTETRRGGDVSTYQLINLSVYDVSGRLVRTLVGEQQEPGMYSVSWDGKDGAGRAVSAGVYLYRLEAGDFAATKKLVVLR